MAKATQGKRTAADVGARIERVLGGLPEDRMTPEARRKRGRTDFVWFCRYYLAEYFSCEAAPFHAEMAELVDTQLRFVGAAPRNHAKSTTVSFAKVIHSLCYELAHYIVVIRDTEQIAVQNVSDIREELETNERLIEDFGLFRSERKWADGDFVTRRDVRVVARGAGQSMRGLRHKHYRPDLIICDDLDNDDAVESRTQREKMYRWFKRVVSNLGNDDCRLFVIGTILHSDGLLARLLKEVDVYVTRIWRAIDEQGRPLWPAKWPLNVLERKKVEIGSRAWATEWMNNPVNEEEQIFRGDQFRRFEDDDLAGMRLDQAGAIDPAIGLKAKNDDSCICVAGTHNGNYYILRVRLRKLRIQQQVEEVVATCREFPRLLKFGFETVAYQAGLKQLVEETSIRYNLQIPAVAVEDISSDKIKRIATLLPLVEQGRVYFPSAKSAYWSPDVEKCLQQFEDLGCSTDSHDDGPDAVERAIKLLRGRTGKRGRVHLS